MATRKNDFSDPIEVSEGGTGATTASGARTNLGITIGARTIEGTTNEIVVTNGNGVLGNPVISMSSNPVIPGSTAVTPPTGPTASQPGSPVVGQLRGNTDTGYAELYSNGYWFPTARPILGTANQIDVADGDSVAGDPTLSISDNAIFPGNSAITAPSGTTVQRPGFPVGGEIRFNTDTNRIEAYSSGAWNSFLFIRNYLTGLTNTVASITTMSFSPGQAADSTNVAFMNNDVSFTKSTANWAEGDTNGGFPSALTLTANTAYYTFIISKENGTIDFGFDTSLTASNLLTDAGPSGYIYYRRIGSARTQTGSTNLETIRQYGDYFTYDVPKQDYTVILGAAGTVDTTVPLSIPSTIPVIVRCIGASERFSAGSSDTRIYILETASAGLANNYFSHTFFPGSGSNNSEGRLMYEVPSTTGSVRLYSILTGNASGNTYIGTIGWIDTRGK